MRKLRLPLGRVFLSLLLAPAALIACAALAWADPACTVAAVRGTALLEHNGARSALTAGQTVEPGDRVTTQAGARIRLNFADGSEVTLGETAVLHVAAAYFDKPANLRTILLDLVSGLIRAGAAKGKAAGSEFQIRTPIAISAVRGTHWIVMARPKETRVYVQEGRVAVGASASTDQFSKLIEGGHWVSVTVQNGVGAVQDSPPGFVDDLVDQTQAAIDGLDSAETVQTAMAGATTATAPVGAVVGAAASTLSAVGSTATATLGAVGNTTVSTLNAVGSTTTAVVGQTVSTVGTTTTVASVVGQTVGSLTGPPAGSSGSSSSGSSSGGSSAGGSSSSSGSSSASGSASSSGSSSSGSSSSASSGGLGGAARSAAGSLKSAVGSLLH
jgi:hypothetical protein